jgi:RNA recognition motif-containing protein
LEAIFSSCGRIKNIKLYADSSAQKSSKTGTIQFETAEEAQKAIAFYNGR